MNRISGSVQNEEPPQFYGGILADAMGLGKTLTMIALVANDLDSREGAVKDTYIDERCTPYVSTTLIIVPPPCKYCIISITYERATALTLP